MEDFRVPNVKTISWTARIGILAFVLIGVFPPWTIRVDIPYRMHTQQNAGFHLILYPPVANPNQRFADRASVEIDWSRLMLEWIILAGAVAVAFVWQRSRPGASEGHPNGAEQSTEQTDNPMPNENPPMPSKSKPVNPSERWYPELSKEQREKMLKEVAQHLKEKQEHLEKKRAAKVLCPTETSQPAEEPTANSKSRESTEADCPKPSPEAQDRILKERKDSQDVEKQVLKKNWTVN